LTFLLRHAKIAPKKSVDGKKDGSYPLQRAGGCCEPVRVLSCITGPRAFRLNNSKAERISCVIGCGLVRGNEGRPGDRRLKPGWYRVTVSTPLTLPSGAFFYAPEQ